MTLLLSLRASSKRPLPSKSRQSAHSFVRAGFDCLLIGGFLLGMILSFGGVFQSDVGKKIELAEGRKAAAFPEVHYAGNAWIRRPDSRSIKLFPGLFEKWFNDHIGFRPQLIQMFQVARYYGWVPHLLSQSPKQARSASTGVMGYLNQGGTTTAGHAQVLVGREGWLFYRTDAVIDDYRGTDLFTTSELARWKQVLTERKNWLAKRGIRYVFVIAPNKHSVYAEFMPRSINRVSEHSRLEQLADYLKDETDLTFINLLEPLMAAKSQRRVFHKTDTHWNAFGAYIGSQEILNPLQTWFPKLHPPALGDYQIATSDCDIISAQLVSPWIKMDLAVILGSPIPFREEVIDLVPRRKDLMVPVQLSCPPKSDIERIQHGGSKYGEIENAFILHDSYMMALAPFLAPHFREVTYHWTDDFPAEAIDKARPQLVIQEIVQRHLMTIDPANPGLVTEELKAAN